MEIEFRGQSERTDRRQKLRQCRRTARAQDNSYSAGLSPNHAEVMKRRLAEVDGQNLLTHPAVLCSKQLSDISGMHSDTRVEFSASKRRKPCTIV